MTTSPPSTNGAARPPVQFADWRTAEATKEQDVQEPTVDLVAAAEAAAIRARTDAEVEKARILAEAEAEAIRIKATEEARKLALANDRVARKAREEDAASNARIAEYDRCREESDRARVAAAAQAEVDAEVEAKKSKGVEKANKKWRRWAIGFYALCAGVALPVQMSAFWNPSKPWMAGAPILLEIAALVVAFGTAAAVANQRPHWHFRLITWVLAFIAASVNFGHGITEFDLATAIGTALASLFGPGVWDLHEHGRLRKRDGVLSRKERNAAENAAKAEAQRLAAEQQKKAADEEAARKAVEAAAAKLAEDREAMFPKVWDRAVKLAADLGQATVTNAIWAQAKFDVEGAKPGESADVIRMRNAAQARVEAAREKRPVNGSSQQVASQVLGSKQKRVYNPPARPGKRRKGDVKFTSAARRQASIAAKQTAGKKD
ncbi:hypothetical protein AB0C91_10210 [Streptomyces sp. NPDC048674]|uniref:hypothetical protein n=1 Tax=Streptomyces sp. NPDC048674 TaxID=3155491 RepID=UPI00343996C1